MNEKSVMRAWASMGLFEAIPDSRPKKLITAAFPYPNSPQHIGHGRTYTITDIYARYLRAKGYNVLFPMGFHVTGTPILAMAKRVKEKDHELLRIFKDIFGIEEALFPKLTDPKKLVKYFSKEIEKGMHEIGYSIDWRRKFYTSDKRFNRFIEWQFRKLAEKGYLKKGKYPLAYCPKDRNVLSAHDTKGDVDPELEEVVLISFETKQGALLASTYRPETIYGVTNLWVKEAEDYAVVEVNGKKYIVAEKAVKNLEGQLEVKVVGKVSGKELVEQEFRSPLGNIVRAFSAPFVDPEWGTGAVMSVPAHAPYDYAALKEAGLGIEPIKIIESPIDCAKEVGRQGIASSADERLEALTKEVYMKELKQGKMLVKGMEGMPVEEARDYVKDKLLNEGKALKAYVLASPVQCRCGEKAIVKVFEDQWFIDYANPEWKKAAKECFAEMRVVPENARKRMEYAIDWLREKPVTRSSGLGTRFIFDRKKMIDALSDSTIYMAYYTIAHLIKDIDLKEVDDQLFDYVMLGKGEGKPGWEGMRKEFLYWYPVDSRHSASDLLMNHLPFFVFNHVAVFGKEHWPKQIVSNGFVLMDGKKMSKSLGNILPLRKAVKGYGADSIRIAAVGSATLEDDANFSGPDAAGIKERLSYFIKLSKKARVSEKDSIDRYIYSVLNRAIAGAEKNMESFEYRDALQKLFYEVYSELRWYERRKKKPNLGEFLAKWSVAISPFAPFTAEIVWANLRKKGIVKGASVCSATWPNAEEVDQKAIENEEAIKELLKDVQKVIEITGKKPALIRLGVAGGWKRQLANLAAEKGMKAMGEVKIEDAKIAQRIARSPTRATKEEEEELIKSAIPLLKKEFGCKVKLGKDSGKAIPGKPEIWIE
ncbi:MAG: leucine--tRNA ligase [Candidatus Anstonellales archaeon]